MLLTGRTRAAGLALAFWLGERNELELAGPVVTTDAALALAAVFRPDVVLLDFHGLRLSLCYVVSLFKALSPATLVLVLTHDSSETMRRRCRAARVDAVFDKTTELETLASLLGRANISNVPDYLRSRQPSYAEAAACICERGLRL